MATAPPFACARADAECFGAHLARRAACAAAEGDVRWRGSAHATCVSKRRMGTPCVRACAHAAIAIYGVASTRELPFDYDAYFRTTVYAICLLLSARYDIKHQFQYEYQYPKLVLEVSWCVRACVGPGAPLACA
jgi:hypothetical protein